MPWSYRLNVFGFFAHPALAAEDPNARIPATKVSSTSAPRCSGCVTTSVCSVAIQAT